MQTTPDPFMSQSSSSTLTDSASPIYLARRSPLEWSRRISQDGRHPQSDHSRIAEPGRPFWWLCDMRLSMRRV
ncbi:hypothetical protein BaRGS_00031849 [Batillaria attramentaria]|uniref:Uncharacterized protein n=1 Tax=Batillaria attramentaria TaxID=370345 RepID=A0ABD0JQG5_9CAEN